MRLLQLAFLGLCSSLLALACGKDEGTGDGSSEGGNGGAPEAVGGAFAGGDAGKSGAGGEGQGDAGQSGTSHGCGELEGDALARGAWDPRFFVAGVTGHDGITPSVYDFAAAPDGSVLATGRFAYFQGAPVPPLLRFREGTWQSAREEWNLEPPGDGFSALALSEDGALALATGDSFGERDGEIWLDRDGTQTSLASFVGQVRTLAWFAGKLYVAGAFALSAESGGFANLAVWDGEQWSEPAGGAADGPVLELLVADGVLYVGGDFDSVGGVESVNIAAFDGEAWSELSYPDSLAVYALARSEAGELYAGGVLGALDAAGGLARRVGSEWQVVAGGLGQFQTRGVVSDLVAHDGVVDVSGCFSAAGGLADAEGAVKAEGLARWDGERWQSLNSGSHAASPWFQPQVCGDESVSALWDMEYQRLAVVDGKLLAGGSFAGVEGVQSQSLAMREDGEGWLAPGAGGLGVSGSLDRLVTGGPECSLYGLGTFTHLAGAPSPGRVARFGEAGWQLLADDLPSDAYCPALTMNEAGALVVACAIFPADGSAAAGLLLSPKEARLEPLALDAELPPLMDAKWGPGGKLWVSGGAERGFVATVTGEHVSVVSDELDGAVQLLDVSDPNEVVVMGTFTRVGALPAQHIARYADGAWSALGEGLVGQPQALARQGGVTYVSTYDEGQGAYLLGAFDGERWRELAGASSGLLVETFYSFNQILPTPAGLLLVGTAELADGSGRGALLYREGKFEAIGGGGVHAIAASGIAAAPDALWIGGLIAEASSGHTLTSSVGVARLVW